MRIACIPTYDKRLDVLPDAIRSLYKQVDVILVVYNGKTNKAIENAVKGFKKVVLKCVDDVADLAKFDYVKLKPGWYDTIFLCDDDLIFAPDYCDTMERGLTEYDLVSLGGKVIKPNFESDTNPNFLTCFIHRFRCFDMLLKPQLIDVPLSGVCAFKAGRFVSMDIELKYKYAADVQLYKLCRVNDVQAVAYTGTEPLVTYNPKMQDKETIWDNHTSPRSLDMGKLVQEIYVTY